MRLVVPDKYAYKSAMWIQKIVFTKNRRQGFGRVKDIVRQPTSGKATDSPAGKPWKDIKTTSVIRSSLARLGCHRNRLSA